MLSSAHEHGRIPAAPFAGGRPASHSGGRLRPHALASPPQFRAGAPADFPTSYPNPEPTHPWSPSSYIVCSSRPRSARRFKLRRKLSSSRWTEQRYASSINSPRAARSTGMKARRSAPPWIFRAAKHYDHALDDGARAHRDRHRRQCGGAGPCRGRDTQRRRKRSLPVTSSRRSNSMSRHGSARRTRNKHALKVRNAAGDEATPAAKGVGGDVLSSTRRPITSGI